MKTTSSLAIIVVSKSRPAILKETLEGFPQQTIKASQIIVVVTCDEDLPPRDRPDFIEFYIGKPGICRQRNLGLEKIRPDIDYVAFFDDDFELKADFLEKAINFLDSCPAIVGFSGRVLFLHHGTRQQAKKLIDEYHPAETYKGTFVCDIKYAILYGCCMIMRRSIISHEKFDENLPLYAFGEDYDISMRVRRYGIIGRFEWCVGAHLESPGGRVNEVQRGYSMIANNWYFMRKGVCHLPPLRAQLRFWAIVVVKRLVMTFWKMLRGDRPFERMRWVYGCLFGVVDIVRGRSSPQRMLDFSK